MKTYASNNIKSIIALSAITTFIYSIIINSSSMLLFLVIMVFLFAILFWSLILGLEPTALPILTLICIILAVIYVYLKGGFDSDHILIINSVIVNTIKLFVLIGGIYYIIKDFVSVKVNVIFLPLFFIYYIFVVYTMV